MAQCARVCSCVPARFANVFDDMRFFVEQLLCHWSQMHVPGWCDDIINFSKKRPKSDALGWRSCAGFHGGLDNS